MQGLMLLMLYQGIYRECQWLHASVHFSPSICMLQTCVERQHASIFIPKVWMFHKMIMFCIMCHRGFLWVHFSYIYLHLCPGLQIRFWWTWFISAKAEHNNKNNNLHWMLLKYNYTHINCWTCPWMYSERCKEICVQLQDVKNLQQTSLQLFIDRCNDCNETFRLIRLSP